MRQLLHKHAWLRYVVAGTVSCGLYLGLYHMMTVEGADNTPRFMMLRLEDIGPGGYYSSLEGLGKLRAVIDYLDERQVSFSMAVIPRWINITAEGARYDKSIDQLDDTYIQAFNRIIAGAAERRGTVGMHGYTHQAGDTYRNDGHHASGIGNEFDVADLPETKTVSFAERRVQESWGRFQRAGITPHFWEAPHYHTAPEQDQVFRSYFGLQYQPDMTIDPNPPSARYENVPNKGFGGTSLGSVYVPTTLSYIPDGKDEKFILNQLSVPERIHSFFYHPFLEFSHLVPVVDEFDRPVIRDGIPEFRYEGDHSSVLQRLIAQLQSKGYPFYSILDYVPFTPASRLKLGSPKTTQVLIGHVSGRDQSDAVLWDKKIGSMSVLQGQFKQLRNDAQPAPRKWATIPYSEGAAFALNSRSDEHRNGLWIVRPTGKLEAYASTGSSFTLSQSWTIPANRWHDLYELDQPNGDCILAGQSQDRSKLLGLYIHNGQVKSIKPYTFRSNSSRELIVRDLGRAQGRKLMLFKENSSQGVEFELDAAGMQWQLNKVELPIPDELGGIRFGDFNGDGQEDILRWDADNLTSRVYQQTPEHTYQLLSVFGPWGKANGRLTVADFDGNGKADIAMYPSDDASMDVALSFQTLHVK
ncbi:DUF2334 domain-containing protein [Paenibacillus sp. GCM10023248]|uniref:DUF2334 domain-containing protein n=1 Tax=Bacillales TaxID=1385 RepID=UPI002379F478|nr:MULTISPECIES: DUF2334 domain-containing protein [Bacillales]MDD9268022.1 DUF2334 domain-containing protein [Paenibacillus sp. MAHUQ-63]MDR6879695.1 hypothetical protein [Bacillus sp. 3255]